MPNPDQTEQSRSHTVFIADEIGIFDIFNQIKYYLSEKESSFLTLLYATKSTEDELKPYWRELQLLEKRFAEKLVVIQLKKAAIAFYRSGIIQEFIEAVINSSITEKMQFIVAGNEEFSTRVHEVLEFLSIQPQSITAIKQTTK